MALSKLAGRLAKLKANTPEKASLITYPVGALYCAYKAKRCGFTDRIALPKRWENELNDARCVAQEIADSKTPSKSEWIGIVYFNSALMRIDVGFERLIRYVTGSKARGVKQLTRQAQSHRISEHALRRWSTVRSQEVNALKHRNPSALIMNRMTYREMLLALEDLVKLLEQEL